MVAVKSAGDLKPVIDGTYPGPLAVHHDAALQAEDAR